MRDLLSGFVGLLAPRRCPGCEEASAGVAVFCDACDGLLERASDPRALFEYGGPVADAIQRFKYGGRSELGSLLGSLMAEHARILGDPIEAVVPVPLHWRRRRSRGYDQAALLARPIARALAVPVFFRGLRRVKHTPPQVGLLRKERRQNLDGAFAPGRLSGPHRVLLVDDVRTTGATLDAARAALKQAGVTEVHTLVLATRVLAEGT